jgi:hypothetical protein
MFIFNKVGIQTPEIDQAAFKEFVTANKIELEIK